MHSDAFYDDHGFLFRLWYMVPVFVLFRMRVYIAWMFSESMCIASGIGAYPVESLPKIGRGPTKRVMRTDEMYAFHQSLYSYYNSSTPM